MSKNKDLRVRLAGHIRCYNEHVDKRDAYPHAQDKAYAEKTMARERAHIARITEEIGDTPRSYCKDCERIHTPQQPNCGRPTK